MAWYFDSSDYVTVADSASLSIPDDDWTICGWFRVSSNSGTDIPRLFSWGTNGNNPSIIIFFVGADAGYLNDDTVGAVVRDDGTNATAVIYPASFKITEHLNEWIFVALTHDNATNKTWLYVLNRAERLFHTDSDIKTLGTVNPADPIYFGNTNALGATTQFHGDLADWGITHGIYLDYEGFRSMLHQTRPYQVPGCVMNVPMIGGRYEEWKNQLTVTNYGTTASDSDPQLRLVTPQALNLPEIADDTNRVSHTLTLSQSCTVVRDAIDSASNTLNLTQSAGHAPLLKPAGSNTLSLGHLAQYIGPKFASAGNFLLLSDSARVPASIEVDASSALHLSQYIVFGGTKRLSAESVLSIADVADNIIKVRTATSQITLTQSATADKIITVKHTLNLQQQVKLGATAVWATNTLHLSQDARFNPKTIGPEITDHYSLPPQQLHLTQSVWVNLRNVSAESVLTLSDTTTVLRPIRLEVEQSLLSTEYVFNPTTGNLDEVQTGLHDTATIAPSTAKGDSDILSFAQTAGVTLVRASGIAASASNTLTFTQDARLSVPASAASTITLTQVAICHAGRVAESELTLSDAASVSIDRGLSTSSTLELSQSVAYTLIIGSTTKQYSPFVGASSDPNAPAAPSTSLQGPMAGIQVPFQLVYPSVGTVTESISLKAANLGNRDSLSFNRISRETRGGTVIVYADPNWPQIETQVIQFSGLLRVEAHSLLDFIETHLGQEIGMIDWEHRYWRGIITAPDEPIVEDRFDSFTASFQFEGELDPTWNPQVVPPSLRYSAIRSTQVDGYYVPNEPQLPTTAEATDYLTAETDSNVIIGQPVYIKANGHIDLASALTAPQVAGLSLSDTVATLAANYITEGKITRTDWTSIIGSESLSAGATYFLDATAGPITTTPPTASGNTLFASGVPQAQ